MITGNKEHFAIEHEVQNKIDGWILGQFRIWVNNKAIGDWNDNSVDLKGCFNWLPTLMEDKVNRSDPSLDSLTGEQVMFKIFDSFFANHNISVIDDTFSRFHISHIGMSSFDTFDVVLIETKNSFRFIWRNEEKKIFDEKTTKGEVFDVLEKAKLEDKEQT